MDTRIATIKEKLAFIEEQNISDSYSLNSLDSAKRILQGIIDHHEQNIRSRFKGIQSLPVDIQIYIFLILPISTIMLFTLIPGCAEAANSVAYRTVKILGMPCREPHLRYRKYFTTFQKTTIAMPTEGGQNKLSLTELPGLVFELPYGLSIVLAKRKYVKEITFLFLGGKEPETVIVNYMRRIGNNRFFQILCQQRTGNQNPVSMRFVFDNVLIECRAFREVCSLPQLTNLEICDSLVILGRSNNDSVQKINGVHDHGYHSMLLSANSHHSSNMIKQLEGYAIANLYHHRELRVGLPNLDSDLSFDGLLEYIMDYNLQGIKFLRLGLNIISAKMASKRIAFLDLSFNKISSLDLESLPNLQVLNLSQNVIYSFSSLKGLSNLHRLKELHLASNLFKDNPFKDFTLSNPGIAMPNMISLNMTSNSLTSVDKIELMFPNLQSLYLGSNQLGTSLALAASNQFQIALPKLQELNLSTNKLPQVINSIGHYPNLISLNLSGNSLLRYIMKFPSHELRYFDISSCNLQSLKSVRFCGSIFKHMRIFYVDNNQILELDNCLTELVSLEVFSASRNRIYNLYADDFKNNLRLEQLDMLFNRFQERNQMDLEYQKKLLSRRVPKVSI